MNVLTTLRDRPSSNGTTRRHLLQSALFAAITLPFAGLVRASAWQQLDAIRDFIGSATPANGELQLTLPLVAEDGSAVPLSIESGRGTPRIRRLALFAPENPTPQIAEFEFGPDVGPLNLATRIRLSESQTVVAVAHTDNGGVIVAERDVRVTNSGCIVAAQPSQNDEMTPRVRLPRSWPAGKSGEVLTMITHPMTTGLVAQTDGSVPTQRIIESFRTTLNDQPVVTATFHRSLAMNPYLRFYLSPQNGGELNFEWVEDTGRTVEHTETLSLG